MANKPPKLDAFGSEDNDPGFIYHLWYFISLIAATVAAFILLVWLTPKPFGIEIAVAIIYTAAAWWQTFCRIRGDNSSYSIRTDAVRQRVPRLLAIHSGFLVVLLAGLIALPFVRSHVPAEWLKESRRGRSWFSLMETFAAIVLLGTEAIICRGILRRAVEAEAPQPVQSSSTPIP